MTSKDLVTIDGTMTSTDVVSYFEHPDNFTFKWSEDPEEVSRRIEAQLLGAETAEALFGGGEDVLKGRDWIGRSMQYQGVQWRPSDVEGEGLPFYALATVVLPDGSIRLLSCGARKVVLQLATADKLALFPLWLRIVEVQVKNPIKGRSAPLELVSAPDPGGEAEF